MMAKTRPLRRSSGSWLLIVSSVDRLPNALPILPVKHRIKPLLNTDEHNFTATRNFVMKGHRRSRSGRLDNTIFGITNLSGLQQITVLSLFLLGRHLDTIQLNVVSTQRKQIAILISGAFARAGERTAHRIWWGIAVDLSFRYL
jgi:hypothetical protein